MESLILVVIVYSIFMLFFFYKNLMDMESMSSYECGFEPNSYTRLSFSYRFFFISILFIIFYVEIFLMESVVVLVLIVGLLYEYVCGSLDWLEVS